MTSTVRAGQSLTLQARAVETGITDVARSVREGSAGGSVTVEPVSGSDGPSTRATYTAPGTPGLYHVLVVINGSISQGITRSAAITVTP